MENLHATITTAVKTFSDRIFDGLKLVSNRLPEAPASISAKVIDPNGYDLIVTVRNGTMKELLTDWSKFSDYLANNDYQPQGGYRQPAAPPPTEPTPAEIEAEINPGMAPNPPDQNGLWFEAETMAATVSDGNVYWKVKGGMFSKFGVMIWPEVIQAAIQSGALWDIEGELDPMRTYNLQGLIAHYELNDKDKPKKVTALRRAAS